MRIKRTTLSTRISDLYNLYDNEKENSESYTQER